MTRKTKLALAIPGVLFGLLILAIAVVNLIPGSYYKSLIASTVESATGRSLVIDGDLEISLFTGLSVKASDIRFANPEWASRPDMATIERFEGSLSLLPLLRGVMDVSLVVDSPDLLLETDDSGQANWHFGVPRKDTETEEGDVDEGGEFALRPFIRLLDVTDADFVFLNSQNDNRIVLGGKNLYIGADNGNLTVEIEGSFNGTPLKLSAGIDDADFLADNQTANITGNGRVGDATIAVTGKAGPLAPAPVLDVTLTMSTDSMASFSALAGRDLPDIGPLSLSMDLTGGEGTYAVSEMRAVLDDEDLSVDASGSLGNLTELSELALEAKIDTDSLMDILKSFGVPLRYSLPDTVDATITASGSIENPVIDRFQASIKGRGLSVDSSGSVRSIKTFEGISTALSLESDSLDPLAELIETELPPFGPVKATANITIEAPGFRDAAIEASLDGESIQAGLTATIEDLLKLAGIEGSIDLNVDSMASLGPFVKRELPASGPVELEGQFAGGNGLKGPLTLDLRMKGEGVSLAVAGRVADLLAADGIDLELSAEAGSLQQVGTLAGMELQDLSPAELRSRFTAGDKAYELSELNLRIGDLDVTGEASFLRPPQKDGRPRFSGKLDIGELDLVKLLKLEADSTVPDSAIEDHADQKQTDDADQKQTDAAEASRVFSTDPLPLDFLRSFDADVKVTFQKLATRRLELDDMAVGLNLEAGVLKLSPLMARVGDGTFGGTVTLDAANPQAALNIDLKMTGATFRDAGGRVNFVADLEGRGESIAAIMASLNGQLEFDVRDATLKKSFLTGFGSSLLNSLNPFTKDKEETELICAMVLFDIKDGVADADGKIAAQMTEVTWFGGGEIDLETEKIRFGMSPKPRKGLGIGLGGLASLVYVKGTLSDPSIALDPKDVAAQYGKYTAAIATGGLSVLVEGLWSKLKANSDVCSKILKKLESEEVPQEETSEQ